MTAIIKTGVPNGSQHVIPPSVVTAEMLASWVLNFMWSLYRNSDFYPTKDAPPVKRVQKTEFTSGDGRPCVLWSIYLTFDPELPSSGTLKEWTATDEISGAISSNNYNT